MNTRELTEWIESEIAAMIDGYGNTPHDAAVFVRDLVTEGEYTELGITERKRAVKILNKKIRAT